MPGRRTTAPAQRPANRWAMTTSFAGTVALRVGRELGCAWASLDLRRPSLSLSQRTRASGGQLHCCAVNDTWGWFLDG